MALERVARTLDVDLIQLPLIMGDSTKQWLSPLTKGWVGVETAVLHSYRIQGWRGYAGEGGLILNLIKAMAFPRIKPRIQSAFVEALFAKNVAFEEDMYELEWLLSNIRKATPRQVRRNFRAMAVRKVSSGSFLKRRRKCLEFFADVEGWMLLEFQKVLGNEGVYAIAEIFATDSYTYRAGWPDVTVWKDGEFQLLEVKAPGDRPHKSQKTIINDIIKPLDLPFALVAVNHAAPESRENTRTSD